MSILIIAANILAAALLWLVLLALGARIRGLLRVPTSPTHRWPVDVALGGWGAATTFLLASLAGATSRTGIVLLVGLLFAAGRWRGIRRPFKSLVPGVIGGLLFLPVALCPPFFYDAMVYHLALPWQALVEGGVRAHPENLFSSFPPLAQLLALPPLAFGFVRVPAILHWLCWVTAAAGVFGLARRGGAPAGTARLAAIAAVVLPIAPLVPAFPAAEAWLLVGLMPAVALATGPCRCGSYAMAGLLAGIATAARLQGLPWSALVVLMVAVRCRGRLRHIAVTSVCWLVGALPWWFKNLILLGDPTAPVLWQREGIETLWRDSRSLLNAGVSLPDCLMSIPRLLGPEFAWLLPLLLVAALTATGARLNVLIAEAAVFGIAAWAISGALPRFLVPSVCLLLTLVAMSRRHRIVRIAAVMTISWCVVVGIIRGSTLMSRIDVARLMFLDFQQAGSLVSPNDPMAAFQEAECLPQESHVLFVAEPRSFSFPRRYTCSSQHDPSPLRAIVESNMPIDEVTKQLCGIGYTHMLVNWRELQRLGDSYPVAPWRTPEGRQRWIELVQSLGPPVVNRDGVQVFELCDSPRESSDEAHSTRPPATQFALRIAEKEKQFQQYTQ